MKTLLYFQSTATTSARHKLDGVCKAAHERGWLVSRFDLHDPAQLHAEIKIWNPVGCIVEFVTDDISLPHKTLALAPTVLLDCNPIMARRKVSTISQHPSSTGTFAARYLLDMNLAAYAYAGWPERKFWDHTRRTAFCAAVKTAGRPLFHIDTGKAPESIKCMQEHIVTSLKALPLPAGIYCVNDSIAVQVLEAANSCGLSIPHDIALLGTDNEEHLCEHTIPTISSVELDFENAGKRCVEIIAEHIANGGPSVHEHFGPLRIVQRSSTRRSVRQDKDVIAALDLIRSRAISGLAPHAVADLFSCSRRMAEMRFRMATGHSILDEIHSVQIEHAKQLLSNPRTKLTLIPSMCGYDSNPFFMNLFRRVTGLTMREWQHKHMSK